MTWRGKLYTRGRLFSCAPRQTRFFSLISVIGKIRFVNIPSNNLEWNLHAYRVVTPFPKGERKVERVGRGVGGGGGGGGRVCVRERENINHWNVTICE